MVLIRFEVYPERRGEFLAAVPALLRERVRTEPGTLDMRLAQDATNPDLFYAYERYSDEEAYLASTQGAAFQAGLSRFAPLLSSIPATLGEGIVVASSH